MSLNLISSLSFLKSKLGTVGGSPSSRLDIRTTSAVRKSEYAAAGLSDSDSSFTDPIKFPSDCETKTILFKYLIAAP